ncbi:MAG: alpha/beta fold hydrolase [Microbacteriaceae bacterium]|nr:MAG: alpha/beta fold hydrolase [Microbacteriaceae bacterium]
MTPEVPVVLLHGVGLDSTMWKPVIDRIGDRALPLDLPGHGNRPPLRLEQTLATLATDILDRLPAQPVHLVGFSLGSLIAQHIARFAPQRLLTLTCVSSVCRRTPAERDAVEARLETARLRFDDSVDASIRRWFPPGTTVSPDIIEQTRRVLLRNDVESYLHAYTAFARGDREIGPELDAITVPALAVAGELDPGSTPEMSRRLAAAIPACRLTIVPHTRHMVPLESTSALCDALTEFITTLEGVAS